MGDFGSVGGRKMYKLTPLQKETMEFLKAQIDEARSHSINFENIVIEDKILSITAKTKMPILFTILFFFIFTPFRLQGYYIF